MPDEQAVAVLSDPNKYATATFARLLQGDSAMPEAWRDCVQGDKLFPQKSLLEQIDAELEELALAKD